MMMLMMMGWKNKQNFVFPLQIVKLVKVGGSQTLRRTKEEIVAKGGV